MEFQTAEIESEQHHCLRGLSLIERDHRHANGGAEGTHWVYVVGLHGIQQHVCWIFVRGIISEVVTAQSKSAPRFQDALFS
jgi:hypothetical protein